MLLACPLLQSGWDNFFLKSGALLKQSTASKLQAPHCPGELLSPVTWKNPRHCLTTRPWSPSGHKPSLDSPRECFWQGRGKERAPPLSHSGLCSALGGEAGSTLDSTVGHHSWIPTRSSGFRVGTGSSGRKGQKNLDIPLPGASETVFGLLGTEALLQEC